MKDADGLCTRLKTPLKKRKDMEIATTAFMETFKKGNFNVSRKQKKTRVFQFFFVTVSFCAILQTDIFH